MKITSEMLKLFDVKYLAENLGWNKGSINLAIIIIIFLNKL